MLGATLEAGAWEARPRDLKESGARRVWVTTPGL